MTKKTVKFILWTVGILAALTLAIEVALTSPLATKTLNKYAAEYIDGDLSFGRASVSLLRDFPSVNVKLDEAKQPIHLPHSADSLSA